MELKNLAAIVTGGSSGLGAATAMSLARSGARVAIFDIDEPSGAAHAARIGGLFTRVDVTSETSVNAGLDAAKARHGVAAILVNCAGVAPCVNTLGSKGPHPLDAFRRTIEINLVGSFITASRFAARLAAFPLSGEDRGVIINTASITAFDGQIGHAAYAASKAGVVGMTLPLARDLGEHAIRVMTIAPGIFATPMLDDVPGAANHHLGSQVPHPTRLGRPEEFAQLVESIIANPMLNGEVIRLDGALRLGAY